MSEMRAKMVIQKVETFGEGDNKVETLSFVAVSKTDGYADDGLDENNTFAKFTPSGELKLTVSNPELHGKFLQGEEYYLDFTKAV